MHTLSIAKGQDERQILEYLEPLVRDTGGRWSVTQSGKGIHADFHFKTFKQTWVQILELIDWVERDDTDTTTQPD
ncbi:MAG: hypothetical protein Q9185_001113 [Variospora sp. 1 TL-2023]